MSLLNSISHVLWIRFKTVLANCHAQRPHTASPTTLVPAHCSGGRSGMWDYPTVGHNNITIACRSMVSFIWPNTSRDIALAREVAASLPNNPGTGRRQKMKLWAMTSLLLTSWWNWRAGHVWTGWNLLSASAGQRMHVHLGFSASCCIYQS